MVYLKSVENVIPLSKLIGLLFLFCVPLLSILFLKTKRNDLACPVMGTIFLVNWASEASPTLGCSIEISRDIIGERAKRARHSQVCSFNRESYILLLG